MITRTVSLLGVMMMTGLIPEALGGRIFYVDSHGGNDQGTGNTEAGAWKTLQKVNKLKIRAGDKIQIKRGSSFQGHLMLAGVIGSETEPVVVDVYGQGELPIIDAKGHLAALQIVNSSYVEVNRLQLTSNGGEGASNAKRKRYGVLVHAFNSAAYKHIYLRELKIRDIFPVEGSPHEGKNPTTHMGMGIQVMSGDSEHMSDVRIENCQITRTGFTGIRLNGKNRAGGSARNLHDVIVAGNRLKDIGGPGIQPGWMEGLVMRGNDVSHSGSSIDQRMHGRGSGTWPFSCNKVLIEKNIFAHARGKGDSCGIHIDYNCSDVIVQHNLSIDNAGGFIEILGNDRNCAYRYNISVNDGFRVKKKGVAHQEGKVLWLSGYVGKKPRTGPYNSYIYNNTIYVKEGARACFSIANTTRGAVIANNIFHLLGPTVDVAGDQKVWREPKGAKVKNIIFKNNVYTRAKTIPPGLVIQDSHPIIGDAGFKNPGGFSAEDYIPTNASLIKDKGIDIPKLPGDPHGLRGGLGVNKDFFGNPITGKPDIGAIEMK